MIYPIALYGNSVLRTKTKPIVPGTDVRELVESMYETMYAAEGIGLAAPQIGKSVRLFVLDSTALERDKEEKNKDDEGGIYHIKQAFINPVILEESGKSWEFQEGCLSIPGIRSDVARLPVVRIKYYDELWQLKTETFTGMPARIIQHEYDHLEGRLFIDYLAPLKRKMLVSKLTDITKGNVDVTYRVAIPKKR